MNRFAALLPAMIVAFASPASAQPSLRETIELTDLSSVAISPDERWAVYRTEVASVERNDYALDWYVVALDGRSPPRRVAGAGVGDWPDGMIFSQPPRWSADSAWFYYRAVIDGEAQVWRARADGGKVEQVTHGDANVTDYALAPGSGAVIYAIGASRDEIARAEAVEADRGVLVDATVDPARTLVRGGRIDGRRATERLTGFWFNHAGLLARRVPRTLVVAAEGEVSRPATKEEAAQLTPSAPAIDIRDGELVLARSASHDRRGTATILARGMSRELVIRRDASTAPIKCQAGACTTASMVGLAWQPRADRVVFTTTDGAGNTGMHVFHVQTGRVSDLATPGGTLNGGRDGTQPCAVGVRSLVCVAAAANAPPRLVRIDYAGGSVQTLADPNASLRTAQTRLFTPLTWMDAKGRRFTGQLLLPEPRQGAVPLFVTYYVCDGYLRGGTGDEFPLRSLADAGIAALCINRPPAAPGLTLQADQYDEALSGIRAVIDRLAAAGTIDRNKVGMGGLSFGGEMTMWVAAQSDLLAAASIATSVLTPTYYWFAAMKGRDAPSLMQQVWGLGDPDSDPASWRRISAAFKAGSIHAPLLMQLPEQEYRSNIEVAARLGRTTTPIEVWAFPDETHIKYQPRHKLAAYERNLDWFRYWLQGYRDPAPDKADQYRRWEGYGRAGAASTLDRDQSSSQPRSHSSTSTSASTR